ncbi:MAG: hypothetical protein CVU56_12765 [Deltaproteobacteria bacterium HGW-Deltaproteobacteria-14]|jgi:uncharacterized membrane protein (UPF0127 family)|nr:MAG: hypothetical protein CVU56_12765 [Deltaproteobacteria bacterium HGW-Deltaproteobacteria-14]
MTRSPRASRRRVIVAALALALLAPSASAAAEPAPPAPATAAPTPGADLARVVFARAAHEVPVAVEVCRTELAERVGYMLRLYVPPYSGMLFMMPTERVQAFWMHNTVAALDMIFVDRQRTVVGIVHRAPPLTEELRYVHRPSAFVIEVASGFARQAGIQVGDTVRFENIPGL